MKKRFIGITLMVIICLACTAAFAGSWTVPGGNAGGYTSGGYTVDAQLIEDLATRSGPSTQYTGCGSYRMNGQTVRVISRAFDNGGVQWVQVEFGYGGAVRRAYTGVKRLNISNNQLASIREEGWTVFIGYGTVSTAVNPKWGPGEYYATYTDRTMGRGTRVAVINYENGYYQVECYHTDGNIFRSWIPSGYLSLD